MSFLINLMRFCLVGIFLFTPHLNIFGYHLKSVYLLASLAGLQLFFQRDVNKHLVILCSVVCALVTIGFVFNATVSFEIIRQVIIFVVLFIFYGGLIKRSSFTQDIQGQLVNFIFLWLVLQSFIIIVSATSENFAEAFHSIFLLTERGDRYIGEDVLVHRYSGFAPSGFSIMSVYMALLTIFVDRVGLAKKAYTYRFSFFVLVLVALIFVGRSGLYLLATYIIIVSIKSNFKQGLLVSLIGIFLMSRMPEFSETMISSFKFAFELFLSGGTSYSTATIIENELFLPEPSFWGHGVLVRSEGGVESDLGWVKLLYCFGYAGTIVYFMTFTYLISNGFRRAIMMSPMFLIVLASFIIFNFKDLYFLASGYIQVVIVFYFFNREKYGLRRIKNPIGFRNLWS